MSDTCWFSITIKEKDKELFVENFEPAKKYDVDSKEVFNKRMAFTFEQANYGFYEELETLSKTPLKFYGNHGAGGSYGPSEFTSDGAEFVIVETGYKGGYVCNFNIDGIPESGTLNEIKKYLKISSEVEEYFDKKKEYPTLRENSESCNT